MFWGFGHRQTDWLTHGQTTDRQHYLLSCYCDWKFKNVISYEPIEPTFEWAKFFGTFCILSLTLLCRNLTFEQRWAGVITFNQMTKYQINLILLELDSNYSCLSGRDCKDLILFILPSVLPSPNPDWIVPGSFQNFGFTKHTAQFWLLPPVIVESIFLSNLSI